MIKLGFWAFDGYLFLIRENNGIELVENLEFNYVDFWVRIYNMLFKKRNRQGIIIICNKVGEALEVDEFDVLGWVKFIRVRARIDLVKVLCRGRKFIIDGKF